MTAKVRPIEQLRELASLHGVLSAYTDQGGKQRQATDDSLIAVLRALGAIDDPNEIPDALVAARDAKRNMVLEPVLVVRKGAPLPYCTLKANSDPSELTYEICKQDGSRLSGSLAELLAGEPKAVETGLVKHELDLSRLALGVGYHDLLLRGRRTDANATLLCAPQRLDLPPRSWGLFSTPYGLRRDEGRALGSYSDLSRLLRLVGEAGGSIVSTLPLYATFYDTPFDPSPYRPVSRLYWNELFIDLDEVPELAFEAGLESLHRAPNGTPSRYIDYRAAYANHRALLKKGLARLSALTTRSHGFEQFMKDDSELASYARFRAGKQQRVGEEESERYHAYVQWLAATQLEAIMSGSAGHGDLGLLVDFPIGVHPEGYDAWRFGELFAKNASIGAPPDLFFEGGQDWGFQPIHPQRQRENGYRYLRSCLAKTLRHARVLRLDHILGLERLFWIPQGFSPEKGVYVENPLEELRAVVLIEASRAGAAVLGEDLGTVSPRIRKAMDEDGFMHSFVTTFEHDKRGRLHRPPRASVASLGTHDLARFAARYGKDHRRNDVEDQLDDQREQAGRAKEATKDALEAELRELLSSQAALVVVDLGDLLGELEPENRPGTSDSRNWSLLLNTTLVELEQSGRLAHLLEHLCASSGRKAVGAHGF